MPEIRALTLHQPWASLVAWLIKGNETRGGPLSCSKLIARGSAVEDWESSAYSCHDCAAGLPEPEFSAEQILARWVSEAEGEADRG